jgi:class 3 adenylate cyclase
MAGEISYARSGASSIAYRVFGEHQPLDLVIAPGFVSNMEVLGELPDVAKATARLASFARLIAFDKREQGLSDRHGRPPTVEEMVDDIRAVMDATDTKRAAIFGISEGAAMALMFAASHPERCTHLALWGGYARMTRASDYPDGISAESLDRWSAGLRRDWGGPASLDVFAPSRLGDPEVERWWAQLLRTGTSPRSVSELMTMYKDRAVPVAAGRYIADHIEGAQFEEFPGTDHLLWTERPDPVLDRVEEFLTGTRRARPAERVLATVLFTDIVDSTARAGELGDRAWRELLDRHDAAIRAGVERHQGRVVKSTGDGALATFDGPARAIACASELVEGLRGLGLEIRAGLHTGECELRGDDVGGMAVHIGARVADRAAAGEVLVSSTVKDLVVGSGIEFAERGAAELKGVPGEWRLYAVGSRR